MHRLKLIPVSLPFNHLTAPPSGSDGFVFPDVTVGPPVAVSGREATVLLPNPLRINGPLR